MKTADEKPKQNSLRKISLPSRSHGSQDCGAAAVDVSNRRGYYLVCTVCKSLRHRTKKVNKGKLLKGARIPDLKIVMRPRSGLRVLDVAQVEISRDVTAAAQFDAIAAREGFICPNHQRNIIIVSTPKREPADSMLW